MFATSGYLRARRYRIAGACGCVILAAVIALLSLRTVPGQNLDTLAMEAMVARGDLAPSGLRIMTSLVSVPAIVLSCAIVVVIAAFRRRFALGVRALGIVCGANLTVQLVKLAITRPDLGVGLNLDNSFPSGHTAFAASVAAALVVVAPRGFQTIAVVLGGLWASLMGQVVMLQGWHRPSDVAGAMLIVAAWTLLLAPVEDAKRLLPLAGRLVTFAAWTVFFAGVVAWGIVLVLTWPNLSAPLYWAELASWSGRGQRVGRWLLVACLVFPLGIEGAVLSSVSRLRGSGHAK